MKRQKFNSLTLNNEEIREEPDIDLKEVINSYIELLKYKDYFDRFKVYNLEDREDYYSKEFLKYTKDLDIALRNFCMFLDKSREEKIQDIHRVILNIVKEYIDEYKSILNRYPEEVTELGYNYLLEDDNFLL